jgi:hypothetical protein
MADKKEFKALVGNFIDYTNHDFRMFYGAK